MQIIIQRMQTRAPPAQILFATPRNAAVFLIKFCMAEDPLSDPAAPLPPVKVRAQPCRYAVYAQKIYKIIG